MDGSENITPLVIGKSAKPRCFKGINSFPTKYGSNKKAWMTTKLFNECVEALNPKGCRFGPSEIYNIVETLPEVLDCLCVSQYGKDKDERVVLFVKIRDGYSFNEDLASKARKSIERYCSFRHVPEVILVVKDIPVCINLSSVFKI
ncbi:acetoacetyl-CoA synthetase [Trichonephila clavipes]|nr:acetoacetyl-CoA synthetase [Trichonephila clavipes]